MPHFFRRYGEFCSEAHRQTYYERQASRLLKRVQEAADYRALRHPGKNGGQNMAATEPEISMPTEPAWYDELSWDSSPDAIGVDQESSLAEFDPAANDEPVGAAPPAAASSNYDWAIPDRWRIMEPAAGKAAALPTRDVSRFGIQTEAESIEAPPASPLAEAVVPAGAERRILRTEATGIELTSAPPPDSTSSALLGPLQPYTALFPLPCLSGPLKAAATPSVPESPQIADVHRLVFPNVLFSGIRAPGKNKPEAFGAKPLMPRMAREIAVRGAAASAAYVHARRTRPQIVMPCWQPPLTETEAAFLHVWNLSAKHGESPAAPNRPALRWRKRAAGLPESFPATEIAGLGKPLACVASSIWDLQGGIGARPETTPELLMDRVAPVQLPDMLPAPNEPVTVWESADRLQPIWSARPANQGSRQQAATAAACGTLAGPSRVWVPAVSRIRARF